MTPEKYICTIDLGTSGPKVALFTTSGESLGYEFEPIRLILHPNGGAEQDPHEWWSAITRATHRLLARNLVPVDSIIALACTAQWSGTVPVDRNGAPLMDAIIWMDSRGAPYIKQITGGGIEFEGYNVGKLWTWLTKTGGIPGHSGKDSIAHILWLKHEHPEIYRAAYKFLEPADYINLRLTGEFAASQAHMILHWVTDNRQINRIAYDPELLRLTTLDPDKLPALRGCIDILGPLKKEVAAELGLPEQVQVIVGSSDVHSAAIGSGAVRDYQANLYIGTSSWLTCHMPFKKTDLFHNQASLPSGIPGRYLLSNEQECAGACLNYLRDTLLLDPDRLVQDEQVQTVYQAFDKMAERVAPGSDRVIFTPWLYGERTPVEDNMVRGGFFNLSL
ncbi:MAG: FGGY-family carbohydrate kinase, partial [Anaerolineae bacterium]